MIYKNSSKGSTKDFFEITNSAVRSAKKKKIEVNIFHHVVNTLTKPKIDKIIKASNGYVKKN